MEIEQGAGMSDHDVEAENLPGRRAVRTPAPTPLGTWIRQARFERRMSQGELADRAGLSRSYVCNIERGYGIQPSVRALDSLAVALDVSRLDLLTAAGVLESAPGSPENEYEKRFMTVFRSLSDEGQSTVERFAKFIQAEEHRWSQLRLIGETDDTPRHPVQSGQALFDLDGLEEVRAQSSELMVER
jgi:transcriptional regulator with XRE-family HTH domain